MPPLSPAPSSVPPARALRMVAEGLNLMGRSLADDVLIVVDKDGRVVFDSHSTSPVAAASWSAFLSRLAPADRALVEVALKDSLTPGLSHVLQFSVGDRIFAGRVSPLRVAGEIAGGMLLAVDVTQMHRQQLRLVRSDRLMRDTEGVAHLGTWEWDPREPNAWWSDELYSIYGLDPKTHVPSYQDYLTRVHPDDRERVIKATESVFKDHKAYSHDERVIRPDGSIRWLHTWAHAVLDDAGNLVRLVGVCQDITERRAAEDALAAQVELLEARVLELESRLKAAQPA